MVPDQAIPWLPLLRELTRLSPTWGVWKNVDSALSGDGDIDSVGPMQDRNAFIGAFRDWTIENDFLPAFICRHVPDVILMVGLLDQRYLVELDLCERQVFRGAPMFDAVALSPMMQMDQRGFRRLRSGAEGLFLMLLSAMRRGGRWNQVVLHQKMIPELLRSDPKGVALAAGLFGAGRKPLLHLAEAAMQGLWDRGAALKVETWAALRSLTDLRLLGSRLIFPMVRKRRCGLWPALIQGRRVEEETDQWLYRVRLSHEEILP